MLDTPKHIFSPAYIWNQLNRGANRGINVETALNLVVNQGCSTLDKMPYSDTIYSQTPSQTARAQAARFKPSSWEYVTSVYDIKASLAQGDPVVWVCNVYPSLADLNSQNYTYTGRTSSSEEAISGHAMCIVGYNDSMCNGTGAVKIINSYDTWGDGGYAWVAYNLLFDPTYTWQTMWTQNDGSAYLYDFYRLIDSNDQLENVTSTSDLTTDDVIILKNTYSTKYGSYLRYMKYGGSGSDTSLYMDSSLDTNNNYSKMIASFDSSTNRYLFCPITSTLESNNFAGSNVYNRNNNYDWRAFLGINTLGVGDLKYYSSLTFKDWYLTPSNGYGSSQGTGYFKLTKPAENSTSEPSYMSTSFGMDTYSDRESYAWQIFKY